VLGTSSQQVQTHDQQMQEAQDHEPFMKLNEPPVLDDEMPLDLN